MHYLAHMDIHIHEDYPICICWIFEVVSVGAVLPGTYCTRMLTRNRVDI